MVPTASLTWQISPTLLNVFRMGWVRDTGQSNATSPTKSAGILNTPGTQTAAGPVALRSAAASAALSTLPSIWTLARPRFQGQWQQDRQFSDDMTKICGQAPDPVRAAD